MQKLAVIEVGKTKEMWIAKGKEEYLKRLKRYALIKIISIKDEPVKPSRSIKQILDNEGSRIEKALPKNYSIIVLDSRGERYSSREFARFLGKKKDRGESIVFITGSSYGLSEGLKKGADTVISFSKMTFPHQMIRVILLEQIYRACSILAGTDYHK